MTDGDERHTSDLHAEPVQYNDACKLHIGLESVSHQPALANPASPRINYAVAKSSLPVNPCPRRP